MKRFMTRAKGRSNRILKPTSHILIELIGYIYMGQKINPIGFRLAVNKSW